MAKTVRRLGLLTSLRGMTPTTPDLAANFMNFKFNFIPQRRLPNPINTQGGYRYTNGQAKSDSRGVGEVLGRGGMPWTDAGVTKTEE